MSTAWGETEARAFLRDAGFGPGPFSVKRLTGGLWNDVLRVEAAGRRMILKHYAAVLPGTLFPNLPDDEAAALHRLAGLGVASDPIGYWPEAGVLLYDYVDGPLWDGDVEAMARLLLRKEAADPTGFRAVPVTPQGILAEGDRLLARCGTGALAARWRQRRPRPTEVPPLERLSLIHTDIGAGNLISGVQGLRLIDWQCPAAGDLAEDMFSFLSPAFQVINQRRPLDAAARARFLAALGLPQATARHAALEPCFAYRMAAYCCLRAETADDSDLRLRYAHSAEAELAQLERAA